MRWCLDFRRLNAVTRKDAFPLPLISDCIESLAGNRYMSTLDMASGYWQIEIHPDDREYTAFITWFGLFEHKRMSMGLCNAPSTFQRAMDLVLRGLAWKTVLAFLDDDLALGQDLKTTSRTFGRFLERFRGYNPSLFSPKFCSLPKESTFLGLSFRLYHQSGRGQEGNQHPSFAPECGVRSSKSMFHSEGEAARVRYGSGSTKARGQCHHYSLQRH